MTLPAAMAVAQIIDAEPDTAANFRPEAFVQDGERIARLMFRRFSPGGRPPHPEPALLLLSTATDFLLTRRLYGQRHGIPRLHLLRGTDVVHWGHGATAEPAVRVAIGERIGRELRRQGMFREPVLSLPIALDPARLPTPASERQPEPLLLAQHSPGLGSALKHTLRQRGITSQLELFPSARARLERAIARAPVVVDLGQGTAQAGPEFPCLTAMALRTPLITVRIDPDDDLCCDGRNALVCDADTENLAKAVLSLLGREAEPLRARLLDGARSTVAQHHPALQRLRFEELLRKFAGQWQRACSVHAGAHADLRSAL